MNTLDIETLKNFKLPVGISWLVGQCMEARGKQELWNKVRPEVIRSLKQLAIVESAESSNRIEGVTVDKDRLLPLLSKQVKARDRSEEEVFGYKKALDWIHTKHKKIEINSDTILYLHELSQSGFLGDAGKWKTKNNEIIEILPSGERKIRFVPLEAKEVPKAIKKLCSNFNLILEKNLFIDLLAIAGFVLDFLCIHPFRDGNGRVSRLLTLLLLYKCNYQVGSFISLERIIESTKEDYYETLKKSSQKWHSSEHDPLPFFHYFIGVVREGYRELTDKVSITEKSSRGGKTELLKKEIISQHTTFTLAEISSAVKTASLQLIKKVLRELKEEGQVKLTGRGRGAVWQVIKRL